MIVNPYSGKGKAERVYRKKVEPLLLACNLKVDILSKLNNHAYSSCFSNKMITKLLPLILTKLMALAYRLPLLVTNVKMKAWIGQG